MLTLVMRGLEEHVCYENTTMTLNAKNLSDQSNRILFVRSNLTTLEEMLIQPLKSE